MTYTAIKHLHMTLAVLSICGFMLRAAMKFYSPLLLHKRWFKITPHAIDTLLLCCAVYLCISSNQYPLTVNWLTAKVAGLFCYIGFGIVLMRLARTKKQQILALTGAIFSFSYIVIVAITKNPYPW